MVQNTSHAVMAQRHKIKNDNLDDFPTPPWATRALLEYVINDSNLKTSNCLEPACNRGHMSKVLCEYFREVISSDVEDYGYGDVKNLLDGSYKKNSFEWVITNPPFRLAEEFLNESFKIAREGVAILARTVFLESVGRYHRIFKENPPTYFAQFTERVPMIKGKLDKKASTATGYAWFVWKFKEKKKSQLVWIPPTRKLLEKENDYEDNIKAQSNKKKNEMINTQTQLL